MSLFDIYVEGTLLPQAAELFQECCDERQVETYMRDEIRQWHSDYDGAESCYLQRVKQMAGAASAEASCAMSACEQPKPRSAKVSKPPPAYLPKQMKLNFRLINDDRLDLGDRIIFSYLWKWAWMNHRRSKQKMPPKAVNVYRVRKATKFRHATVRASLAKLRMLGYIDKRLEPLTRHEKLLRGKADKVLYRKLRWDRNGDCIRLNVFRAIVQTNSKKCSAGWFAKALGISRRTYYRYKAAVTGGTTVVPVGTA